MNAIFQWLLSSWLARQLRGRKTHLFAGSLVLIAADHFLGTGFAAQIMETRDLTNAEAVTGGLLGLAFHALRAGISRHQHEQTEAMNEMVKMLRAVIEAAQKAAPAILAVAFVGLIGCTASNGITVGNKLAGASVGGSLSTTGGVTANVGATLAGQQLGLAGDVDLGEGRGSAAVSVDIGLCDALASIGMAGPAGICGQ